MFGLGRVRATPAQLALALLFQYWGRGSENDEEWVDLLSSRADVVTVRTELYCLNYFATCFGIEVGFGKAFAVRNTVLNGIHYFNRVWTADPPDTADDPRAVEAKHLLHNMLAEYKSANPEVWERINNNRNALPPHTLVSSRHDSYRNVMMHGVEGSFSQFAGEADAGYKAVAATFTEHLGSGRDPIVLAGAYTELVMQVAMVRDVVPKYKLIT